MNKLPQELQLAEVLYLWFPFLLFHHVYQTYHCKIWGKVMHKKLRDEHSDQN